MAITLSFVIYQVPNLLYTLPDSHTTTQSTVWEFSLLNQGMIRDTVGTGHVYMHIFLHK